MSAAARLAASRRWWSALPAPAKIRCRPFAPCSHPAARLHTTPRTMQRDGDDDVPDGSERHRRFEEQMRELEKERRALFGEEGPTGADESGGGEVGEPFGMYGGGTDAAAEASASVEHLGTDGGNIAGATGRNSPTEHELEEMHDARAAMFGFTDEDREAWSSAGGEEPHRHGADFMEALRLARARQDGERQVVGGGEEEANEQGGVGFDDEELYKTADASPDGSDGAFTHLTPGGESVSMVDVGHKAVSARTAMARSLVVFPPEVMDAFGARREKGADELVGPKGPIFATAKIAGIMAAKKTSDLIPLCHPLPLDRVHVDIRLEGNTAIIECECRVTHKTGVEMEALTGATVTALTIYDMVKAVSHEVKITDTVLVSKSGGRRVVRNQSLQQN